MKKTLAAEQKRTATAGSSAALTTVKIVLSDADHRPTLPAIAGKPAGRGDFRTE